LVIRKAQLEILGELTKVVSAPEIETRFSFANANDSHYLQKSLEQVLSSFRRFIGSVIEARIVGIYPHPQLSPSYEGLFFNYYQSGTIPDTEKTRIED
jgi:hypothetical protein